MFSLVDALLLRPIPVSDPASLVDVFTTGGDGGAHATSSYPDFDDLRARNAVFTDMIGYSPMMAAVSLGDRSRLVFGQVVTSNHFQLLGVRPERGRVLEPRRRPPRRRARRRVVAPDVGARVRRRSGGGRENAADSRQPYTIVRHRAAKVSPASSRCCAGAVAAGRAPG
jgi:hypothetical protein